MKRPVLLLILIIFFAWPVTAQKSGGKTRLLRSARPAELKGSTAQRVEQNTKAIDLGIEQISTQENLDVLVAKKLLVELTDSDHYFIDRGTAAKRKNKKRKFSVLCPPKDYRIFVRPEIKNYLDRFAADFFEEFKKNKKLKITSGTRTLEEQILMRTKKSCYYTHHAAKVAEPLEESLHPRGNTIDISRRVILIAKGKKKETSMSRAETRWMRERLLSDKNNGFKNGAETLEIQPIEENHCYHIVIFQKK